MFEKTFERINKVMESLDDDMKNVQAEIRRVLDPKTKFTGRVKVTVHNGDISIDGEFLTLTVNGQRVEQLCRRKP